MIFEKQFITVSLLCRLKIVKISFCSLSQSSINRAKKLKEKDKEQVRCDFDFEFDFWNYRRFLLLMKRQPKILGIYIQFILKYWVTKCAFNILKYILSILYYLIYLHLSSEHFIYFLIRCPSHSLCSDVTILENRFSILCISTAHSNIKCLSQDIKINFIIYNFPATALIQKTIHSHVLCPSLWITHEKLLLFSFIIGHLSSNTSGQTSILL